MSHYWFRDISRAAEDAAAVPAIQHRDLPEAVAALTERVAELTRKHNSLAELARLDAGWLKANEQRLTAERDAARAECERLRACADPFNEEMAVIAAWERCAITADWPADEPETAVRCAASMEREIVRLRARVAELEAAASAATILAKIRDSEWSVASQLAAEANAELSAAPAARGWLTAEERDAVEFARAYYHAQTCGMNEDGGWYRLHKQRQLACESLLARSTPPRVKVPHLDDLESDERPVWESACREWIAAIRAAGGEVE